MRKMVSLCVFLFVIAIMITTVVMSKQDRFTPVEGSSLASKMDKAIKEARAGSQSQRFWVGYSFEVRPGFAVDYKLGEFRGTTDTFSGITIAIGTSGNATVETRNMGVFLLNEADGNRISQVKIHNLDRDHDYGSYPVYWLGHVENNESLDFLNTLVESDQANTLSADLPIAIALHNSERDASMLKRLLSKSSADRMRAPSVFWLGQIGGELTLLADIVGNDQDSTEVRKEALYAIGKTNDKIVYSVLSGLYDKINNREVKKQIIEVISNNEEPRTYENQDAVVSFLTQVATNETDHRLRSEASSRLSRFKNSQ